MTTVKTLIVYDKSGGIIACYNAEGAAAPVGVPYIIVDIPEGISVQSVDVKTATPIYVKDNLIISEIDKMNSKMDYIAMMSDIDISNVMDAGSYTTTNQLEDREHSANYNKVLNYYLTDLWSLLAVRNAYIKSWITSAEYNTIVKAKNEADATLDTENEIPTVTV